MVKPMRIFGPAPVLKNSCNPAVEVNEPTPRNSSDGSISTQGIRTSHRPRERLAARVALSQARMFSDRHARWLSDASIRAVIPATTPCSSAVASGGADPTAYSRERRSLTWRSTISRLQGRRQAA